MTKDRTAAFKAATLEYETKEKSEVQALVELERNELFEEVEDLSSKIHLASEKVDSVAKKQSDLLSAPLANQEEEKKLDELMSDVMNLISGIRNRLNAMERNIESNHKKKVTQAQTRIHRIQCNKLTHDFKNVVETYKANQVEYKERRKKLLKKKLEITGRITNDSEFENMLDSGNSDIFIQSFFSEEAAAKQLLSDVKARHADLLKLEKGIRELNEMFVDLAVMVDEQGALVDQIEHQTNEAKEAVTIAVGELRQGKKKQRAARKKKIIIFSILLLILLFVILIIVLAKFL